MSHTYENEFSYILWTECTNASIISKLDLNNVKHMNNLLSFNDKKY